MNQDHPQERQRHLFHVERTGRRRLIRRCHPSLSTRPRRLGPVRPSAPNVQRHVSQPHGRAVISCSADARRTLALVAAPGSSRWCRGRSRGQAPGQWARAHRHRSATSLASSDPRPIRGPAAQRPAARRVGRSTARHLRHHTVVTLNGTVSADALAIRRPPALLSLLAFLSCRCCHRGPGSGFPTASPVSRQGRRRALGPCSDPPAIDASA